VEGVKTYTAGQVRAAEAPLLDAGVPLMERAAEALAEEAATLLAEYRGGVRGAKVLLLVGSGNNGGDTLYAGAILAADGAEVTIVPTSSRLHDEGLVAALVAGATMGESGANSDPGDSDAARVRPTRLTGTSASPALRGTAREIVAAILPALVGKDGADAPLVVAVDIPSGIGPDDGSVPDPAAVLPAYLTVTFGGCKAGLLREPASRFAGRIVVADIGLGAELDRVAPQP
jgi:NAD(P)H-hydrate epimerase